MSAKGREGDEATVHSTVSIQPLLFEESPVQVRPRLALLWRLIIHRGLNLYLTVTFIVAAMVAISAIAKIRHDPRVVRTIHEIVGLPLSYFPLLAACEFAGALGLVLGIFWPLLGILAGVGLALYFLAAILSHFRVGDFTGFGPAFFMWIAVMVALGMRLHLGPHPHWYRL